MLSTSSLSDAADHTKWWMKNRDRFLLGVFLLIFLALMGMVPSPISAMREEHQRLLHILQVNCYNSAELVPDRMLRERQMKRCLTLTVDE